MSSQTRACKARQGNKVTYSDAAAGAFRGMQAGVDGERWERLAGAGLPASRPWIHGSLPQAAAQAGGWPLVPIGTWTRWKAAGSALCRQGRQGHRTGRISLLWRQTGGGGGAGGERRRGSATQRRRRKRQKWGRRRARQAARVSRRRHGRPRRLSVDESQARKVPKYECRTATALCEWEMQPEFDSVPAPADDARRSCNQDCLWGMRR